tara:strand:+ start:5255 stop:5455 length:201 start_codon:yes stop_codon:yes gene_type:complete
MIYEIVGGPKKPKWDWLDCPIPEIIPDSFETVNALDLIVLGDIPVVGSSVKRYDYLDLPLIDMPYD